MALAPMRLPLRPKACFEVFALQLDAIKRFGAINRLINDFQNVATSR